jgi:hypothetical protein
MITITVKHLFGTLAIVQLYNIEHTVITNKGNDYKVELVFKDYEQAFNFWVEYNKIALKIL